MERWGSAPSCRTGPRKPRRQRVPALRRRLRVLGFDYRRDTTYRLRSPIHPPTVG